MKNSLDKKGLSMSEAQSISNICYQKALDISNKLAVVNNFSRTVEVDGKTYLEHQANPLPENIVELIGLKAKYHGTQAFLMENIKAKDNLLLSLKNEAFNYTVAQPEMGAMAVAKLEAEVGEAWGREQLTLDEVNEYLLRETEAAHIGQFIHARSTLDNLRRELPTLRTLEWMELEAGKKTPVVVNIHHTAEALSSLYEQFSASHREAEQKVNFYKAKMKNLVTAENARIAEVNGVELARVSDINSGIREEYTKAFAKWREDYSVAVKVFEADRNKRIQEASALKIKTAPQFKATVDEILQTLKG